MSVAEGVESKREKQTRMIAAAITKTPEPRRMAMTNFLVEGLTSGGNREKGRKYLFRGSLSFQRRGRGIARIPASVLYELVDVQNNGIDTYRTLQMVVTMKFCFLSPHCTS